MMNTQSRKRVLVVDDESTVRESLQLILGRNYDVNIAESGDDALLMIEKIAKQGEEQLPDIVLLDLMMPGSSGLSTLEQLNANYPTLPVIMLTASKGVRSAVEAMKSGAVDYLNKPYDVDELLGLIEQTLDPENPGNQQRASLVKAREHNRPELPKYEGDFGLLVGTHPVMKELYGKIEQLAPRDTTILINGESGTGKELVAKEIHQRSLRREGPFIAVNCAAIPETLIESELFGHEKGAFTHAVEKRIGLFEQANNGTLFLDEIGELSLPVQVKMLRFLQDQEFYRVGRSTPIRVDVRILAATNRSLETAITENRFRKDLYYRINVVNLEVPPLRKRIEDVPVLVDFFIKRFSTLYGNRKPIISKEAMNVLTQYSWGGNVRELENIVESVIALSTADEIGVSDLPTRLRQDSQDNGLKQKVLDGSMPFEQAEQAFEREIILKALEQTNFVQTRAAELLGISRRILKYKMDKLGITEKSVSSKGH